ncbi:MAG: HEPN domain-containing protein [Candidatus Micrarchaeota archaeon]|nr:HEPN domain-containing protein [Candidatus Micrarchaeota archaeon]
MGIDAMENSDMWLATAQAALGKGIGTTALYCAEMAVEIALKGVLLELRVDIPKSHNIVPLARACIEENRKKLPKEFNERLEFVLGTLSELLDLRPLAGYAFERNVDEGELGEKAKDYVKMAAEATRLCKIATVHVAKKND